MLAGQKCRLDVRIETAVPLGLSALGHLLALVHPGIVHQDVDASRDQRRLTHHLCDLLLVSHVARDAGNAKFFKTITIFGQVLEIPDNNLGTMLGKQDCGRPADPGCPPGNNSHFVLQVGHDTPSTSEL